MTCNLVVKENF